MALVNKYRIALALGLFSFAPLLAQSGRTTTTASLSSICYNNGSVQASWINTNATLPILPTLNGSPFAQSVPSAIDSAGNFSLTLADVNIVIPNSPNLSYWKITACAKGGSQPSCASANVPATGANFDATPYFAGATTACSGGGGGPSIHPQVPGLIVFGDSIANYVGCTTPSSCFVSLLANQLGGSLTNVAVSGYWIQDEATEYYVGGPPNPTQGNNPLNLEEAGKNDGNVCATDTNCIANSQLALNTILTHRGSNNIVPVSSCSTNGTWAADGVISIAKASTTNGSTLSCTITTYGASGAIGVPYRAITSNGGTASVTIDGTPRTGIVATGVGGFPVVNGDRPSIFENMYPVPPGVHTVLITVTSATSGSNLISIPDIVANPNPAFYAQAPYIGAMEVIPQEGNANPTYFAAVNTMKVSTVATLIGYGFNTAFLPINNVPYAGAFNYNTYISNQPGASNPDGLSCAGGTTDIVHPNNCGHMQIFQALQYDLNIVQASAPGSGLLVSTIQTANYTVQGNDGAVYLSTGPTVTLPGGLPTGQFVNIVNIDASLPSAVVAGAGASYTGPASIPAGASIIVINYGNNWFVSADQGFRQLQKFVTTAVNYTVKSFDGVIVSTSGAAITFPNSLVTGQQVSVYNGDASLTAAINGPGVLPSVPSLLFPGQGIILSNNGGVWFPVASTNQLSNFQTPSAPYTAQIFDTTIIASGAHTVTLPTGLPSGQRIAIYNGDASLNLPLTIGANLNIPTSLPPAAGIIVENHGDNWFMVSATNLLVGGTVTPTLGTGITSATCATAACNSLRGTYTIVGGTATTGTILSLAWPATPAAYVCTATMNGGTGFLGIGNSVATTTGMNITAGVTVLGLTFSVNYSCQP